MDIKQAIGSIAKGNSIMASIAREALKTDTGILDFTRYITDQFNQGNAASMSITHGYDVIDSIVKYGKMITARAETQCANICIMMDTINLN